MARLVGTTGVVFTGEIVGAGTLAASRTVTAAAFNAADSQAHSFVVVPAPGAGRIVVPLALIVASADPDSGGLATVVVGFGTAGDQISLADTLVVGGGNGNMVLFGANPAFAASGDIGAPVNVWLAGGTVDGGPYVVTVLYYVTPAS